MARLGDICKFQSGGTPAKSNPLYFGGNIPWITTVALNGDFIDENHAVDWITDQALIESSAKMVPANSIMVGARVGVGKTAINKVPMSTSQDIISLLEIDESKWDKAFVSKWLSAQNRYLQSQARGATIKGIKIETIANLEIPELSVERQRFISAYLDNVSALVSLRKQQLAKLDELVKARFVEMFGDLKLNDKNWPVFSFNSFAKIDTTMVHDFTEYGDCPHIGIDSIEKNTGILSGYRTVREDRVISGKYLFTPEHVIYSKIRPNLNKVALPDFGGVCSADAYPILPKKGKSNRVFLAYALRSPVFLDYILAFSSRTNLPKVNKQQVEGFHCPLPDLGIQDQFASFFDKAARQKRTVQQSLAQLETLKKSLMQDYFG